METPLFDSLMAAALEQARLAFKLGEVPIGAVIAQGDSIIARAHNLVETNRDPTAHAERLVISQAAEALGDWRLLDVVLCVTLEPCTMCAGAIKLARIPTVVFGGLDPNLGAVGSNFDLAQDSRIGPVPRVVSGVRERESIALLKRFFEARR